MLFAFEGLALIISHGEPVEHPGRAGARDRKRRSPHVVNGHHIVLMEKVNHISTFAKIFGAGTYSELIWALVIVIVLQVALTFTRWGLYTVAIGSNKLGAAEAGVQREVDHDPQLRAVRHHRRPRRDPRGGARRDACSRTPPGPTKSCSSRSRRR